MDRSGRSTPHTRNSSYTHTETRLSTDTYISDDFLLLSSPSYEDIENLDELECNNTENKMNIAIDEMHQKQQSLLIPQNQSITAAIPITPIYTMSHNRWQLLCYIIMILLILLYLYSFIQYQSHYNNYFQLYNTNILYVNMYNMVSILFYLFLIILCLIFGYQYKIIKSIHRTNKVALGGVLVRLSKANMSKRKKCINLLKFYKRIFVFEWTEFGIICVLTLLHFILSGILLLSQSRHHKTTYNLAAYMLTTIRYVLNGFAIILLALCLNIYYDHIIHMREYLFQYRDSISDNTLITVRSVPPDIIPEDQQTDIATDVHASAKTNQTDEHSSETAKHSVKQLKNINIILNDSIIHWGIFSIFVIFIVTHIMLCVFNWDCYNDINHILYGYHTYFIVNELLLKLFSAILLFNTCLHILCGNNFTYNPNRMECYGFVISIIKPVHILLIILMSFVEIILHCEMLWNIICALFYAILIIIVFIIWCIISKKAHAIIVPNNNGSTLRSVMDGIILMVFSVITNAFLLLNDYKRWTNITQISSNLFNIMQLILIRTLKRIITDKRCYKYVRRKRLKSLLLGLIILNIYHICYSLIFVVYTYQDIWHTEHNKYYRISFSLSFTIIQFTQWILCQLLCLHVQIFPIKVMRTAAVSLARSRRSTKSYVGGEHRWRYSASGYPAISCIKKSKYVKKRSSNSLV